MILLGLIGAASVSYVVLESLVFQYAPTVMSGKTIEEVWRVSTEVYQRPICHLASVVVGYMAGCLHNSKMLHAQKLLRSRTELYVFSMAAMLYAVMGGHPWISGSWDYTEQPFYPAFYGAIHRPLAALGVAIIYLVREHRRVGTKTGSSVSGEQLKVSPYLLEHRYSLSPLYAVFSIFRIFSHA